MYKFYEVKREKDTNLNNQRKGNYGKDLDNDICILLTRYKVCGPIVHFQLHNNYDCWMW